MGMGSVFAAIVGDRTGVAGAAMAVGGARVSAGVPEAADIRGVGAETAGAGAWGAGGEGAAGEPPHPMATATRNISRMARLRVTLPSSSSALIGLSDYPSSIRPACVPSSLPESPVHRHAARSVLHRCSFNALRRRVRENRRLDDARRDHRSLLAATAAVTIATWLDHRQDLLLTLWLTLLCHLLSPPFFQCSAPKVSKAGARLG